MMWHQFFKIGRNPRSKLLKTPALIWAALFLLVNLESLASSEAAQEQCRANEQQARREGELTVYSSLPDSANNVLMRTFQKEFSQIKINIVRSSSARLGRRIEIEQRAGLLNVDVVITSADVLESLKESESSLLERCPPENVNAYRPGRVDPTFRWTGLILDPRVVAVNSAITSEHEIQQLRELKDLLEPKWNGKIAINVNDRTWMAGLSQSMGTEAAIEFLRHLKTQRPRQVTNSSVVSDLNVAGEFQIGVNSSLYDVIGRQRKGAPIDIAPITPLISSVTGISLSRRAPHPNAARLFLHFVTSRNGQATIANLMGRVPARIDVSTGVKNLSQDNFFVVEYRRNYRETSADLRDLFVAEASEPTRGQPAPPIEGISPLPPPSKPAASTAQRGVYWNAWVESEGKPVDVMNIMAPVPYTMYLDLSPYHYETLLTFSRAVGSTEVDNKVKSILEQNSDRSEIMLYVRAISIGSQVKVATPRETFEPMVLMLERLREPRTASAQKTESEVLTAITGTSKSANISLERLGASVRGGSVSFALTPTAKGCATIAFSVWMKVGGGVQPLDHIIFRIAVGDPSTPVLRCDNNRGMTRLRGGFGTLLSSALSRVDDPAHTNDAGLHIFEHGAGKAEASIAVFAIRKESNGSIDVFSWQTESIISTFIEDRTQLPQHVYNARIAARNEDSKYPYAEVADLMKLKIFAGRSDEDKVQADRALKALQNLVAGKADARVAARLYSFRDEPLFVPLNLLSASSEVPILRNSIVVVQPLPHETYPTNQVCVDSWTFGIPDQLSDAGRASALISRFTSENAQWLQPRLRNRKDAIGFFETQPRVGDSGEGLLLLAHQGHGQLWFDDAEGKIQKEHIKRTYPEGSVAILTACSTANQAENNGEILEKLNRTGIQGMVVSPFAVDAEYSAMLAVAFAQEIKAARAQLSLLDLFGRAAKSVVEKLNATKNPSIQGEMAKEMAREFLVLGDHSLKICGGP